MVEIIILELLIKTVIKKRVLGGIVRDNGNMGLMIF